MNNEMSLWIVMLDVSSSMERGYASHSSNSDKFETAKEVLINSLDELPLTQLALITFNNAASIIFEGSSNNKIDILRALNRVSTSGDTSISEAFALIHAKNYQQKYSKININIITDGDVDEDDISSLLDDLNPKQISINPTLIDPSPHAINLAKQLALNGKVNIVKSKQDLSDALRQNIRDFKINQNVSVTDSTVKNIIQIAFSPELPKITGKYARNYISHLVHMASNPSQLLFSNTGEETFLYLGISLLLGTGLHRQWPDCAWIYREADGYEWIGQPKIAVL